VFWTRQEPAGLQQGRGPHAGARAKARRESADEPVVEVGQCRAGHGQPVEGEEAAPAEQGADLVRGQGAPDVCMYEHTAISNTCCIY